MSEGKQRSGIFKFFYIVLSIITFPIFVILFILRHPFWVLFFLCLVAGGAAYYPISQGVKPEEVISWYQKKYQDIKFEVVTNAVESGKTDFIPQAIVDEVVKTKQKMEEEKAEAARPKSENYNENISRDKKVEEVKIDLKKRKSGFKKKVTTDEGKVSEGSSSSENVSVQESEEMTLDVQTLSAGGLAGVLSDGADEDMQKQNAPTPVVQENGENISRPTFTEKNDAETINQPQALLQKENVSAKSEKMEEKAPSRDIKAEVPMLPSTDNTLPGVLADEDTVVSTEVLETIEDVSEGNTVPTLLPHEDKAARAGDALNVKVEKKEGGENLEANKAEEASSRLQAPQQIQSHTQSAAVTDESDVLMLFPEDDIVEGNETEKAPQSLPTVSGDESDVPMLLPTTPAVDSTVKGDEVAKAPQPQPTVSGGESDVPMLLPATPAVDSTVKGDEVAKAPQSQPTVSGGESDVPMLLPATPAVDSTVKGDETEEIAQPQSVDDIFSDEAFEDLKLF